VRVDDERIVVDDKRSGRCKVVHNDRIGYVMRHDIGKLICVGLSDFNDGEDLSLRAISAANCAFVVHW